MEVPNIISIKDLAYIKDMLNWLFISIKKYNHYIDIVSDDTVRNFIIECVNIHIKDYNKLLDILN